MGDPRRSAWMCSPTPRPWGFSGNFTAQQQPASNVFIVSWMSGWGMNRWICKATWEKKEEKKQKLQFLSLSPDRLVCPPYFLPSISMPLAELRKLLWMPALSERERCRWLCLKVESVSLFFILSHVHWSAVKYLWEVSSGRSIQNLNTC